MSPTSIRKVGAATTLLVSGLVAGGVLTGTLTANAATTASTPGYGSTAPQRAQDTAVTGTEADKVKAAVKAKNAGVTITEVRKDPDGSYDALGTDASGNRVFYDVSADLKTVTAGGGRGPGGGGRGPGGPGGGQHTATTAAETAKVKAAVKASSAAGAATATITEVRKDADGSFDAVGTDASGNRVFYDVSADYKTVTAGAGGRGPGGGGQHTAATADETSKVKAAVTAKNAGVTITEVRKDADGSFDALGTDASGNRVLYDVSADYATVTAHTGGPKGGAPAGAPPAAPSA